MAAVETAREVLVTLAGRYAFREVAALVGAGAAGNELTTRTVAQIQQLCAYGQRLLDLDAEDLANPDATAGASTDTEVADRVHGDAVPRHLIERGRACRMPQSPQERERGALGSLRPAYRLLLEVMAVRWQRRETAALVATAHIASEYASALAWESVLGHAADPARLARDSSFTGPHSRFGVYDAPNCPHTRAQHSAAHRALRVAHASPADWRAYLDRQHSTVSHALGVCAAECPHPCSLIEERHPQDRAGLTDACHAATALAESALVRLRHSAPVGHGFGVPSPTEVAQAWAQSRETIARHGGAGAAALAEDGFALPGLPSLLSAIAAAEITPDTLLTDTAREVINTLGSSDTTISG